MSDSNVQIEEVYKVGFMIGVYLYDIFGASAGNKSSHPSI